MWYALLIKQTLYVNVLVISLIALPAIQFDGLPMKTFNRITNDTLFLDPNCMDCFHEIYVRSK